ncbi:MAG: diadenylate cyclase [Syntrophorhabdales bacterium]|jgi:DNA integrity scanning protein DisA with diadenylate cyclase activity
MPHRLLKNIMDQIERVNKATLEKVIWLAIEIAREGREGRKVGTLFVVSDSENVLKHSRPLILDPLFGHPDSAKCVDDPNMRETIKELALLDGGFIVSDDGVCVSACRYIEASVEDIDLPLGLGSRHLAAASITKRTRAVAVVVSESSVVRVFQNGRIISRIIPEIWLLSQHSRLMTGSDREEMDGGVTVVTKADEPA